MRQPAERRRTQVASGHSDPAGGQIYFSVAAIALSCYANSLGGDFVHDDVPAVLQNRDVLGLTGLSELFVNDFWGTRMSDPNSHKSYRPLTVLTFRANYILSGLEPYWFHAWNVVLHTMAAVLFTRVCVVVAGLRPQFAAIAGALFAAHPVHTEAVSGIVGRADVLACVLFLLSFLAYHGKPEMEDCQISTVGLWTSVFFGALAMLSKEIGVTVILVNLLYDLYRSWPFVKRSIFCLQWNKETVQFARRAARILISLCFLLAIRLALLQGTWPRFSIQDNPAAFHPSRQVRFLTFCYLAAYNCWLILCPWSLSHDWQMGSLPLITSVADSRNLATILLLGFCVALIYRSICDFEQQKQTPLILGCLFLVMPFLPATNLIITVGFVVAERVLFIPSLGFLILVVYGVQLVWSSLIRHRWLLMSGGCLLLLIFCGRTVVRNNDWTSREALIKSGLKAVPHNAKMHYNLANLLKDKEQYDEAVFHYQQALRLWPAYASAHNNMGTLMSIPEQAKVHFLEAIKHSPDHVHAHYNLGQIYKLENRTADAVQMLRRCVKLVKEQSSKHHSNAVENILQHIMRLQPKNPDNIVEFARWMHVIGHEWKALVNHQNVLSMIPHHRDSVMGIAIALRSRGHAARAIRLAQRVALNRRGSSRVCSKAMKAC
ncbi:protein O-mannosyl-transferase TMTC1-like [Cloeon dipterum]|uniref:dolichyl-phosphate-mannose--protein mannosyltransferase n=1 Tax=Cloeon dipterum TaxID=197152 RepID=A0A8S1CWN7_9INSE|nr:Hypothetical predicted protein [Cloeon dipterum]